MLSSIYPIISLVVFWATVGCVAILALRMIFSYADPNPFSKVGRFAYKLRRHTEKFVQPFASFLFIYRIDKKYAPLLTALIICVLAYFGLRIIHDAFFVIDGLTISSTSGNIKAIIGFLIYAIISIYVLFIFLRIISSWFVYKQNSFFGFVRRVTDPIMIPLQRLIPPIGMVDISAMIILILLNLLQGFVLRALVN